MNVADPAAAKAAVPPADAPSAPVSGQGSRANPPTAPDRNSVLAALADRPYRFKFFQAVRLLTRDARRTAGGSKEPPRPVGHDYSPQSEVVRFRSLPSHSFPPAEIAAFAPPPADEDADPAPAEMTVAFLGLTGPMGALPHHYTQTVIDRMRLKDSTLLDFLDLFNHRIVSLFYRAWEKHRVVPLLERAQAEGREDPVTRGLYSLVGVGTPALRNRLETSDSLLLYYCGLFAHYPRNPLSLERLLCEWFGLPVVIMQFHGQWLDLEPLEQTAMPTATLPNGLNCQLGVATIAGQRVWSVETKFRVRIGPLGYDAFQGLLPGGRMLTQIGQVVRMYAGPELDFDSQLILRRDEVPPCQLAPTGVGARLGWNTWATSIPRENDANEPVFLADGRPSR